MNSKYLESQSGAAMVNVFGVLLILVGLSGLSVAMFNFDIPPPNVLTGTGSDLSMQRPELQVKPPSKS